MPFDRKDLFLKSLWWSIIGAVIIAALFWLVSDIFGLFKGASGIFAFADGLIYASVIGNLLGTGLIAWRISDKYYPDKMPRLLRRYTGLSVLNISVVTGLLFTPLALITSIWTVVPPLYLLLIFARANLFNTPRSQNSH
ncbi:MAG: hypothetical protein ACREGA_01020 [Candidatus Saccharimonadales bacterium]